MAVLSIYHPFGNDLHVVSAIKAMQHFCDLLTLHHNFHLG